MLGIAANYQYPASSILKRTPLSSTVRQDNDTQAAGMCKAERHKKLAYAIIITIPTKHTCTNIFFTASVQTHNIND
jgi:hypothetical protein